VNRDYLIGNKFASGNGLNKTSFKPGHRPWNKNKKGIHLSPGTEFKKGRISLTKVPIGTVRQRTDGHGKIRNFIKIAEPDQWRELSWYRWKSAFGFIKGDVVHILNGNTLDDRITNLIAMPRADHPKFNGRWGLKKLTYQQIKSYLTRYQSPFINYKLND
jgi:hypothetical protein